VGETFAKKILGAGNTALEEERINKLVEKITPENSHQKINQTKDSKLRHSSV
jgi:putative lipoic acid-binding regulatory protein